MPGAGPAALLGSAHVDLLAPHVLALAAGTVGIVMGAAAVVRGLASGDRSRALVGLAVVQVGGVELLFAVDAWRGNQDAIVPVLAWLGYVGIGAALVATRHLHLPLGPRTRRAVIAGLTASAAAGPVVGVPRTDATLSPEQAVVMAVVLAGWLVAVLEPAARFWTGARDRPGLQRCKMRALGGGFAGIAAVVAMQVAASSLHAYDSVAVVVHAAVLLVMPVLHLSLTAAPVLYRSWRRTEKRRLGTLLDELLGGAPDRATVAERALRWAQRLVGGDGALLLAGDGSVVAAADVSEALAERLRHDVAATRPRAGAGATVLPVLQCPAGVHRALRVTVSLDQRQPAGTLVVVGGPFTPFFGTAELDALEQLATLLGAAFERVGLTEEIEARAEHDRQLLAAIDAMGIGLVIADDQRLVYANRTVEQLTGFDTEELTSRSFLELIVPDDVPGVEAAVRQRLDGTLTHSHHLLTARCKDGTTRPVELTGVALDGGARAVAAVRDRSTQVVALEREHRRANQLATLASAAGRLAAAHEEGALLTAIAAAALEVTGCDAAAVVLADRSPAGVDAWSPLAGLSLTERGRPPWPSTMEIAGDADLLADLPLDELGGERGLWRDHELPGPLCLAVPIECDRTEVARLYLACRPAPAGTPDGGHHRALDDEDEAVVMSLAAHAGEALRAVELLAAERDRVHELQALDELKNAFLSAVSHELRTPLTVVAGVVTTLTGRRDLTDGDRESLLRALRRNVHRLDRLVGDLLDVERLQRGMFEPERRPCNLAGLIRRIVGEIEVDLARPLCLDLAEVTVDLDATKVERIVENLVANALKYTEPATPIWVRLWYDDQLGGAVLAVEDAGTGVPEHLRTAIFQPFQQGPDRPAHAPGVGLGLSLVARFAQLHGGRAWVEDRDGGGASFRVLLPAVLHQDGKPLVQLSLPIL